MRTEDVPQWPSKDDIFNTTVREHNDGLDPPAKAKAERLHASESITLIIMCAALQCSIPERYLLTTRGKGIDDHLTYLKSYLSAVKDGAAPCGKGTRVAKHIHRFAICLGITPEDINQALLRHPLLLS